MAKQTTVTCDRCGKKSRSEEPLTWSRVNRLANREVVDYYSTNLEDHFAPLIDLCAACTADLDRFMSGAS